MNLEEEIAKLEADLNQAIKNKEWDVPLGAPIEYFDPELSYELTGYKPIDKTHGLDFNPNWFTEARETYEKTGKYCAYLPGSKKFREFWKEQYRRCKYGMTVNGYTVTGFHYFFLNFYTLPLVTKVEEAGKGRPEGFPSFTVAQYIWFHYLALCCKLLKNAALMKARGIGFSEINAAMAAAEFTVIRESNTVITCHDDGKLRKTLKKAWHALAFLDKNTQGGMSKNKQIKNTDLEKTSGAYIMDHGTKIPTGWQSTILGIVADDPQKIRGDRADFLLYDEAGSWPGLETAVTQGEALVEIGGVRFGVMVFGGTGGDSGPALEGLRKIYYNPTEQNVLPYRHHYTEGEEVVETGFFIPAYQQMYEYLDERGWCDPEKTKPILQNKRNTKLNNPKAYLEHCAEYCWTAEEAFAQEGKNKFNKALIAEQLTRIRALKIGPRPKAGRLMPVYKNDKCKFKEIENFRWIPDQLSKLQILEHPIWSDLYREQQNKEREKALAEGKRFEEEAQVYGEMKDLYIAGVDGVDIGAAQTSKQTKDPSDFCIVIKKRAFGMQEPIIVALYKDRPQDVNTAYKVAMCLCKYYNAKINVEATRVGFLNWAKRENLLSYFMKRPRATLADIRSGNTKAYGTPATGAIIEMQTDLVATYVEDYSHNIWFEEILEELQKYNPENKRKFDIVASLGMVELADQELSARVPIKVETEADQQFQDFGYWKDSKGYIHKGVIPKKEKQEIRYAEFREDREAYDPFAIETSDPRYHSLFVQEGLYRTNTYKGIRPYRV